MWPPHLSVAIPKGKRNKDPVSTGIPISHPISDGPQDCTPLSTKNVISTPFIIQAAKQTTNANVLTPSAHQASLRSTGNMTWFPDFGIGRRSAFLAYGSGTSMLSGSSVVALAVAHTNGQLGAFARGRDSELPAHGLNA